MIDLRRGEIFELQSIYKDQKIALHTYAARTKPSQHTKAVLLCQYAKNKNHIPPVCISARYHNRLTKEIYCVSVKSVTSFIINI